MLKIAVCDDAQFHVEYTQSLIKKWEESKNYPVHVTPFESGDSLLEALSKESFDIILLDIMMPLISGIDVAAEIRKYNSTVKIIFVSSSSEFGVTSYSVKASNYLLKPLNKEQLFAALNEVVEEIMEEPDALICKSNGMVHRIPLADIEYIEAQDKYVMIYLVHKGAVKVLEPMYQLEKRLPVGRDFFKCHRSYMINLHYVNSFNNKEITTLFGNAVPISRKHAKEFQETFFAYAFDND